MLPYSLLATWIFLSGSMAAFAQKSAIEVYRVRIVTREGRNVHGVLDTVTDHDLSVNDLNSRQRHRQTRIALTNISKVVIRSDRRHTLEGALVGGAVFAFLSLESGRKTPFRSPILFGINVALTTAVGAGAGALIGKNVRPVGHRTVRPLGQTPDEAVENMRRQLEPFSYSRQNDILNQVPP